MIDDPKLVPGRELDTLIAEKVMGWKTVERTFPGGVGWDTGEKRLRNWRSWAPSTNIAHAWEVVKHLNHNKRAELRLGVLPLGSIYANFNYQEHNDIAETAPLAICLAALKYMGVTTSEEKA